jgi:hypothetical protein
MAILPHTFPKNKNSEKWLYDASKIVYIITITRYLLELNMTSEWWDYSLHSGGIGSNNHFEIVVVVVVVVVIVFVVVGGGGGGGGDGGGQDSNRTLGGAHFFK